MEVLAGYMEGHNIYINEHKAYIELNHFRLSLTHFIVSDIEYIDKSKIYNKSTVVFNGLTYEMLDKSHKIGNHEDEGMYKITFLSGKQSIVLLDKPTYDMIYASVFKHEKP
ncbi:MAG: hypothetical protein Q4F95_03450 [Oscillospiraceae bacterium]|nr:hypothetical protein [Oscillospiraceae bacterium]